MVEHPSASLPASPALAGPDDRSVDPPRRSRARPAKKPAPPPAPKPSTGVPRPAAALPRPQIEALNRQQQRIRHRTQVIAYVLTTEHRNGSARRLGDALTELLADINDAVQTIGTILHPVPSRRP